MKRIYLFSTVASLMLLFSACGDSWLDEMLPQTSAETEKSLNTLTEAEYALNGIYSLYRNYEYYGARYTYYGDAKSEDMQARGDSKRVARYYLFTHNAVNAPSGFWTYPYVAIRNANNIIAFTDRYTPTDAEKTRFDNIRGQALTMRAMSHFDLVKIYGMPYTKDNGASLGVPVVTEKMPNDAKPSRNTVAEVYVQVIKDLEEASGLISNKKNDGQLNWFATRLLLARAYLYRNDNAKAYDVATDLLKKAEGTSFRLFTTAEYPKAWSEPTGPEYFYVIVNSAEEISDSKEFLSYLMHRSGYDDLSLSSDYIDLIDEDKNDVRSTIINRYSASAYRWYLWKYVSPDYQVSNMPILRISEAYLIAAEAAVKLGDRENAAEYLNYIVRRANPEKSVTAEDMTLERVLKERRKELVGEGHRLFDAMRNNQTIERKGKSHNSALLTDETRSFNWDFYKILLP
ncbi:MAG: RagB/SusD family nutrient uptake outer membrane protein, partial [Tannerella sp.]|nr:RagB/SusD family nutrient uptake outer membrane protein [Tannerella sp.]